MQINKALSRPIRDRVLKDRPVLDAAGNPKYHKVPVLDENGQAVLELVVVSHGVLQKRVKLEDAPLTQDTIEQYIDVDAEPDGIHFHVELDDGRALDFHIGRSAFEAVSSPEERQAIIDAEIAQLTTAPTIEAKRTWTDGII